MTRKKLLSLLLFIYLTFIIYVMFFGFDRPNFVNKNPEFRYSIIPNDIPLWFPTKLSYLWAISIGNLICFVPFGILVPMIFNFGYKKFITYFLIFIFTLEVLQTITRLGSFDTEDIIVNSIGVTIGFISYKIICKQKETPKKIFYGVISIFVLTFLSILFAEIFNKIVDILF